MGRMWGTTWRCTAQLWLVAVVAASIYAMTPTRSHTCQELAPVVTPAVRSPNTDERALLDATTSTEGFANHEVSVGAVGATVLDYDLSPSCNAGVDVEPSGVENFYNEKTHDNGYLSSPLGESSSTELITDNRGLDYDDDYSAAVDDENEFFTANSLLFTTVDPNESLEESAAIPAVSVPTMEAREVAVVQSNDSAIQTLHDSWGGVAAIRELRARGRASKALLSRFRALQQNEGQGDDDAEDGTAALLMLLLANLDAPSTNTESAPGTNLSIIDSMEDGTVSQELLNLSTMTDLLRTGARGATCLVRTIQQLTVPLAGPPKVCQCFDFGEKSVVCSGFRLVRLLVVNLMGLVNDVPKANELNWEGVPQSAQRLWLNRAVPSSVGIPLEWQSVEDEAEAYAVLWQSIVEAWKVQAIPLNRCGEQLFPAWSCKLILTAPVEIGASPPLGLFLVREAPGGSLHGNARETDVLITFRGTHTAAEAKADFRFNLKAIPEIDPKIAVHEGFYRITSAYAKPIGDALAELAATRHLGTITIAGHSLGGGLAQVLPAVLRAKRADMAALLDRVPVRIVTFGSPRPGNEPFVKYLCSKSLVRSLVAEYDPVPNLPCNGLTQCMEPAESHRLGPFADSPGRIEVPLSGLPASWRLRSAWSWHSCSYSCFLSLKLRTSSPYNCDELACELDIWT